MAETILAIDVGSSLIKLVQIESTFKGATLKNFASLSNTYGTGREQPLLRGDGEEAPLGSPYVQRAQAIARTVRDHGLQSDHVVLGIPPNKVFLRYLRFPFTRSSKIAQVLDFELESLLPVPVGDLVTAFHKEEKTPGGEQMVLAGAISKTELSEIVNAFRDVHLNLELVDIFWYGVLALLQDGGDVVPSTMALVDLGWDTTGVLLVRQGRIAGHRFSAKGMSSFVTEEGRKHFEDQGEIATTPPTINEKSLREWAGQVHSLIDLLTMADKCAVPRPEQIVLCGGGSLVQGMDSALEIFTHIPVQNIEEIKSNFFSMLPDIAGRASLFHVASGLALRARKSYLGFNFCTGPLAPQSTFHDGKKRFMYVAIGCFIVFAVYVFCQVSELRFKQNQLRIINHEIHTIVQRILPDVRSGMRPSQYLAILKDRLAGFNDQDINDGTYAGSAVEAMFVISSIVDKSFKVHLGMLALDGKKVRLYGSANGFATVETMKQRLQTSPGFSHVVIKGAKSMGKDGSVRFTLELDRV